MLHINQSLQTLRLFRLRRNSRLIEARASRPFGGSDYSLMKALAWWREKLFTVGRINRKLCSPKPELRQCLKNEDAVSSGRQNNKDFPEYIVNGKGNTFG